MIGTKKKGDNKNRTIFKAFSLMEVIVSVAIFSVIILSTTEIFRLVIDGQRGAIASQNVQESLKYFLEVIAKEMRMAQRDNGVCSGVPDSDIFSLQTTADGDVLRFKNYYGECVTYETASSSSDTRRGFKITRNADYGFISPLQINMDRLDFVVNSVASSQPLVTVNLKAHALGGKQFLSEMTLQTSVSSRYYK
jgi:prepilin-type N-terminal cleavage/methylation domain-containing protein